MFIHLSTYIYKITCRIKHRCHFGLRSQLAEQKGLACQPVGEFSPALSLSSGKETALLVSVPLSMLASPVAEGEHIWRVREWRWGGEDSGPTHFRGICCGLFSPKPLGSWSTLGACWDHGIPCLVIGTRAPGHAARIM